MKLYRLLMAALVMCVASATAQTKTAAKSKADFSDEDLKKYAITMDSVKGMQQTLIAIITEMVQQNKVMTVQRYNELFKITSDPAKLNEAKATPEEIAFLREVEDKRVEENARINATYQGLAKEYVGAKAFNAIKKSLESDESVKAKYEAINKEIESKGE